MKLFRPIVENKKSKQMIQHIIKLIWKKKGSNSLIMLEIFLSFLVLFAVLSLVFYQTDRMNAPLGFDIENKWLIQIDRKYKTDSTNLDGIFVDLKRELMATKYIKSVGICNAMSPFSGSTMETVDDAQGFPITTRLVYADEDFAKSLNLKITEGRWFNEEDKSAIYDPMVVNKYFIETYFPNQNMMDSTIDLNGQKKIIGVMEDYRYTGIYEQFQATTFFFLPKRKPQMAVLSLDLIEGTPLSFEIELNELVKSLIKSTNFTISNVSNLRDNTHKMTWLPIVIISSICFFLCFNVALGLFGVLWSNIQKRKSEIGLRRAIGAHTTDIAKQFIVEILMVAAFAVVIGLFFTIQIPILKIIPIDSMIFFRAMFFAVLIIFAIVSLCALYPSNQAARIHPATALHED